jgi:hypothetical protein
MGAQQSNHTKRTVNRPPNAQNSRKIPPDDCDTYTVIPLEMGMEMDDELGTWLTVKLEVYEDRRVISEVVRQLHEARGKFRY